MSKHLDLDYESTDDDDDDDDDDDKDDDQWLRENFSLDYMKHAVDYFDETNATTGQRKRIWCSLKHMFRRILNPPLSSICCEAGSTKKQKVDDIDSYVCYQFESARYKLFMILICLDGVLKRLAN